MIEFQPKNNKFYMPEFRTLKTSKSKEDAAYLSIVQHSDPIENFILNNQFNTSLSDHAITLENFVAMYEPIRNELAEKKLRELKLTRKEILILDRLNEKLDLLLGDEPTDFQKENQRLIAQAHRILFNSGLGRG